MRIGSALLMCGVLMQAPACAAPPYDAGPVGSEDGYTVSTQDVDPPGRVGRLSEVLGQVWLYSPEDREWVTAERNRPLTTGDRIATDALARAEMRVGSTVIRLDSNSELEVLRLDDDHLQLQQHRGASVVRLRDSELAPQFEMVTAEGRFRTDRAGAYRFDRNDKSTQATVISGRLNYEGRNQALTIDREQRAEFLLDAHGRAQYAIIEPKRDAFAAWNADRDRDERDEWASQRYVSPEMTGVEDLDRHGRWDQDPEYGAVWIPRAVAPGWAPYTTGRWTWVAPWGWTWVDAAPWGFAPFHYGRWVQRRNVWCWAPGSYVARPVYAPALVGWAGGRPPVRRPGVSIDISIGRGSGGWYPLSPRERYVPGFRSSPRYERELNRSHLPHVDSPRDRIDRGDRGDRPDRVDRGDRNDRPDRVDRGDRNDRNDRNDRGDRGDRGERGERPPMALPRPPADRGLPPQVTGTLPGAAPLIPGRPRSGDRGEPRGARGGETPNLSPGLLAPGVASPVPAPRPSVRPAPPPQSPAAPVIRSTAPTPVNPELMRRPETRNEWFEAVRENHERRQAPAARAEPVQPAVERNGGRPPPRGAEGGEARRERPSTPGGGDQRVDPRDGRDRRNAN